MTPKSALSLAILLVFLAVFPPPTTARDGLEHPGRFAPLSQLQMNASASTCLQDDEIPGGQLAEINNVAITFVRVALGPDPVTAYGNLSAAAQKITSEKQFEYYMRSTVDPFAPFANLSVSHTYLANVWGGPQGNRLVCGTLSKPEDSVSFRVNPSSKQAWVLINGKARNNSWAFAIWLVLVDGGWKVNSFNAGMSTLANQSATDLWKTAQQEDKRHHAFNAFVLYNVALQLAQRGSLFEYGLASVIREHLASTPRPPLFQGKPPFTWKLGTENFQVINAGPLAVAGKIYLDIAYQVKPWKNYSQVDQEDRKLIESFTAALPEYSAVFAGIIAEAHEIGGNQGYRTVAVIHDGKLEILPAPGHER